MSGTEALWLLEGSACGHIAHIHRGAVVIRPAVHVLRYGQLIVRAPVQENILTGRPTLTYHTGDVRPDGSGWSITATGPAELVTDPDETAHHRRTLPGWAHGPHDTLLLLHPQTVTGHRLHPGQAL
ncbi:pyridoxamine 5'-phosphate oxidase family protein [Streptomyces inusitatus]|nr:pyridoxamine 5'-phosphate oxidase family protein [Streptomyces inusitatus]